jgi:dipeptidyl-peptidase-3
LGNLGNYKSFGDVKFIPRCDAKVFEALATLSSKAKKHYDAINGAIFPAAEPGLMHLGFPEDGHLTTYYPDSPTIKKSEIAAVGEFLESKGMLVVSILAKSLFVEREFTWIRRIPDCAKPLTVLSNCY